MSFLRSTQGERRHSGEASSKGTARRAAPLPVLQFQWRRRRLENSPHAGLTHCATSRHFLSVFLSLGSSQVLHIYTSYVHEPQRQSRGKSVYLFWRRPRTRVSLRRSRRARFVLRGGGFGGREKQTSKNICRPLLEDEQSQSYIYQDAVMRNCFHMGA